MALIRLRLCTGWSKPLLVAHTTLLEIICHGSLYSLSIGMGDNQHAEAHGLSFHTDAQTTLMEITCHGTLYSLCICTGDNQLAEAHGLSFDTDAQPIHSLTVISCCHSPAVVLTGPRSAVGIMSGYRCVSDCRLSGPEFDPCLVPYFCGD